MSTIEPKTKRPGSHGWRTIRNEKPVLDNQLKVRTPENIEFNYQVAGPFRRVNAYVLDVVVSQLALWAVFIAIGIVLFFFFLILGGGGFGNFASTAFGIYWGMGIVVAFVSLWFYGAIMETYFNGQTVGKMCFGLRVLSTDGSAIDGVQAMLRNFFRLFDMMPMVGTGLLFGADYETGITFPTALFGLIAMLVSRKYQRIGDMVAGTIVVAEQRKWAHGLAEFDDVRVAGLAEIIPNSFDVSASLAMALSDYVDRRRFLPPQRVAEIAAHLGVPLNERFALPADTNHDLLLCALYYKTFVDELPDEDMTHSAPLELPPKASKVSGSEGKAGP